MSNSNSMEMVAKGMDVAARTIDLLAVVGGLTSATGAAALIARELGRWLGREGLDENELQFFLSKSQGLVMPNQEETVVRFLKAVNSGRSHPTVVPFWAQPSGSMGRYLANDPLQQWITSTICCLFRYHDETSIKRLLSYFLVLMAQKDNEPSFPEYRMNRMSEKLRLDAVVKKVVESTWLHIANSGLLGTGAECPRLPAEFDWACKGGHKLDSYYLSLLMRKVCEDSPMELILQCRHLPTDAILWLLCHYAGRLRVVVNAKIIYDRILGPDAGVLECRVAAFCSADKSHCLADDDDEPPQLYENVKGSLHLLLESTVYQDLSMGGFVRQKLYEWPDCYPREQEAIQKLTRATARDVMRWFLEQPFYPGAMPGPRFFIARPEESVSDHTLKIGELFGRSPQLLNKDWGSLKRPITVFSANGEEHRPNGFDNMDDNEESINSILHSFPILRDLVGNVQKKCECKSCASLPTSSDHPDTAGDVVLRYDENCLAYLALSEVMFYFSHGIADAFGAPDSSGAAYRVEDPDAVLEAMKILRDTSDGKEGFFSWSTILNTAVRVFLGPKCHALLTAAQREARNIHQTVVAVQYGSLAVVAPWLDVSQPLNHRRSFRFEIVQGQLALDHGEVNGQRTFRRISSDMCIIKTHDTEDVTQLNSTLSHTLQGPRTLLHLDGDKSEQQWNWVLVPVDQITSKLLLRAVSGVHSRMINASHAFPALGHTIDIPACSHTTLDEGTVPEEALVELNSFEELLGRWFDIDNDEKTAGKRCTTYIRIAHPLDSAFKFNVAVALAGDRITFVNHGNCCLDCSFGFVMERDKIRPYPGDDTPVYCIIHRVNTSPGKSPQSLPVRRAVRAIEGHAQP